MRNDEKSYNILVGGEAMDVVQSIVATLQSLPPEKQKEVLDFAEFLRGKNEIKQPRRSLKGALAHLKLKISEEDIDEARREMWRGYMREDFE